MCVSEGCGRLATLMATDPEDPKVVLLLCPFVTCAPLAKQSGFTVRLLPKRKRVTS